MGGAIIDRVLLLTALASLMAAQGRGDGERLACAGRCACWNQTRDQQTLTLDCARRAINYTLDNWPPHASHLVATFAHNPLKHLKRIPHSKAKTISLSYQNCSLQSLESGLFVDCGNIEYLDLSWNMLVSEDIHADVFRGRYNNDRYEPIALTDLNLAHNGIESLEHRVFEHTPNLAALDLSSNPLHMLDDNTWSAIASVARLRHLNIANTFLNDLPDEQIVKQHPTNLAHLDLSHNQLTSIPQSLAVMSRTLEKLDVSNNSIQELNDESFLGLDNLRELYINNMMQLQFVRHNTFGNLKHLCSLHLSHNPSLSHIDDGAFGQPENQPPISELYLNDNNLRQLSPALLNWRTVTIVRLAGNHWLCPCEHPPCVCLPQHISSRNLGDFEASEPHAAGRVFLILVPLVLGFLAGVFCWRVLAKYRSYRAVNTMYPVVYSSTPTSPIH